MTETISTGHRMPLATHVREARARLARVTIAVSIAAVLSYIYSDAGLDVLRQPILEIAQSQSATLSYGTVTSAFDLRLQIAMFGGTVLSSPVWLYEIFAFAAPALTRTEKRYVFGFLGVAIPLFAAGCAAGMWVFPRMVLLLASFVPAEDGTILEASEYYSFVMKVVLAAGLAFVLPVFIVALNFLGILSAQSLGRSWRVCIVVIMVFSAAVTPAADVISMFLIAAPLAGLCLAAYGVAYLHDRRIAQRMASVEASDRPKWSTTSTNPFVAKHEGV